MTMCAINKTIMTQTSPPLSPPTEKIRKLKLREFKWFAPSPTTTKGPRAVFCDSNSGPED